MKKSILLAILFLIIVIAVIIGMDKNEKDKTELENLLASACKKVAAKEVSDYWNRTCEVNGKNEDCSLDVEVASEINASAEMYYQKCLVSYRADEDSYNRDFLSWVINESEVSIY